jgi:hypothetical protein
MTTTTLLLVPGGLWEDMDAHRFWHRPGVVAALQRRGFDARTADRLHRAPSWAGEADHLAAALPDHPVTVLAGSNGCCWPGRPPPAIPRRTRGSRGR